MNDMPKIKMILDVDPQQAQFITALIYLWSIDTLQESHYDYEGLKPLEDLISDLSNRLWHEEFGLFSGGVEGGFISEEFEGMARDIIARQLWDIRSLSFPNTPKWDAVKNHLEALVNSKDLHAIIKSEQKQR
jgi:hypothetical protein